MTITIRAAKDFWPGLIFCVTGAAAVALGRESSMGTATKMGPGWFPTMLGGLLVLIGAALVVRALVAPGARIGALAVRPIVLVLGATVLFGLIVRGAGLAVGIVLLVMISAAASRFVRWPAAVALALGLAVFSALVFVKVLGLPMPLVGRWFGG